MECRDFESVTIDLARDRLMEANERAQAVAHAQECRACAARLEDERALVAGLAALTASFGQQEAPRRVEEALLAAFRNRADIASPSRSARWIRIAAAAAAAIIIIAALLWSRQPGANDHLAVPRKDEPPPTKNERDRKLEELEPVVGSNESAPERKPKHRGPRRAKNTDRAASSETEIATDFFPLVDYDNLINFESGEIRRVMLSRSSLVSLGLPVNMDRANEPVKADVLVGHDGLARAIRFIR
jgi:hypothetical protein